MAKATLLIVQGIEQGTRYELGDEPITIGRSMHNGIRLHDTEVSRTHASVARQNGQYLLADRNSSNGTFVNGAQVRTRILTSGDQIQIGRTLFLFTAPDADENSVATLQVDLFSPHESADRSSIVGQVRPDSDPNLSGDDLAASQSLANLRALYRISEEAVRSSVSIEQLLQRILNLAIEAMGADRGCVLLSDPATGEIRPQAVGYRVGVDASHRIPVSRSIVDYVLKTAQGVRTSDAQHDARFSAGNSILQAGIREAMCVPIQSRHELMGVLYVDITTSADQVVMSGHRSRFNEGQLRFMVAIGRQAAMAVENSRYQQAIVKAERLAAIGQTIATLSHHIKNILQGVRGGSYLIDLGLKDQNTELVRKGWGIVEKNQGKIYHLVMDMLTFSKERQPALKLTSVNETVQDIFELIQARAEECQVELVYKPGDSVPMSTFDPEGIHRSVLNIVINAIDAVEGAEHARVVIETGHQLPADLLWVSVSDNGSGISEENLGKMFNLFESTKGARGTGLGLAVSQKIIREHGGDITVETKLGKGSRFTLSWPRLDEENAQAVVRPADH